ncbi:MAG: (2Fe-2S) ferredoxin domain-containing protein [Bdellovibrionales bacterium]|jgi:predicted metal-binding protein|nr:(2Fe-2S) ferredoxin domain-containing protein [Bdellovibrionales bacterium]
MSDTPQITTISRPFNLHVLVCTNARAPGEKQSCGPLGAETIRAELKSWLRDEMIARPNLKGKIKVRVNGSGCLDFCKQGIVLAVYGFNETALGDFLLHVKNTPEDIETVKAKIRAHLDEFETA